MSKLKYELYIEGRKLGLDDAEANTFAGYSGKTPSHALDLWAMCEVFQDETNSWGQGPQALRRMLGAWGDEINRLESSIAKLRARRNEVARRMRICTLWLETSKGEDV
jgi:hypothetical protein